MWLFLSCVLCFSSFASSPLSESLEQARYMYDAVRRDFALSASFVLECFDGSEVTTREGNELVVQKENCVMEETKEVELRSRRGKFIYNRTYNSVGLNKVSHFSRRDRAPRRLPIKNYNLFYRKHGR